jgi:hypothetical protein
MGLGTRRAASETLNLSPTSPEAWWEVLHTLSLGLWRDLWRVQS